MADKFFSLDFQEELVIVTDAKQVGQNLDIKTIGYFETEPGFFTGETEKIISNQARRIQTAIKSLSINKKNVVIVIPDSLTYTQILTMPQLNEKELISAIKYQAEKFIPMPIEEASIDLEVLEEKKEEKNILVLIVAAPKKLVEKIQQVIELCGLIPEALENETSAIARYLFAYKINPQVLVNFNYNSTSLYYFDPQSNIIKEYYNFKIGYQLFLKELQINSSLSSNQTKEFLRKYDPIDKKNSFDATAIFAPPLKEFTVELRHFFNLIEEKYHQKISQISFSNYIIYFPALTKILAASLPIQVNFLNPYQMVNKNPLVESHREELPLFIASFGANFR